MLTLTLSPAGELRVVCPSGRSLDVGENIESIRIIKRMLRDEASGLRHQPGYIGSFPTQAVIDTWLRRNEEAKHEAAKAEFAAEGIDLDAIRIDL